MVCCSPWGCEESDMTLGLHKSNICSLIHYLSFKSQIFFWKINNGMAEQEMNESMLIYLFFKQPSQLKSTFPGSAVVNNLPDNEAGVRDVGLISGLRRSPGTSSGSPLQSSCLENPMDRGSWWATVHRVAKTHTRLKK